MTKLVNRASVCWISRKKNEKAPQLCYTQIGKLRMMNGRSQIEGARAMISKSPSGALSPYYYKGGYFHGIHYGSYFNDMDALRDMMAREEEFIVRSPEKRRVMIDLHETHLAPLMVAEFTAHIGRLRDKIYKLAIAGDNKTIKAVRNSLLKADVLGKGQMYFCFDMEEGKTWLVSDSTR